jgi:hypothetical protein
MDRQTRVFVVALAIIAPLAVSQGSAAETVMLPCPIFKTGNSWLYHVKTSRGSETKSLIVLSAETKTFILGMKTIASDIPGSDTRKANPESEIEFEDTGSVIGTKSTRIGPLLVSVDPPEPVCGALPLQSEVTTKSSLNGVTAATAKATITVKSLGKEKITVPAGTFDANVVEIRRQELPGSQSSPGASAGASTVQIMYAVKDIGTVKDFITVNRPGPHSSSAANSNVDAYYEVRTESELQSFVVNH